MLSGVAFVYWERAVATILQFSNHRLFDPAAADAMGATFDTAWASVLKSTRVFGSDEEREHVRELLAFRIIDTASRGEFNAIKLHDDALACLARQRVSKWSAVSSQGQSPKEGRA